MKDTSSPCKAADVLREDTAKRKCEEEGEALRGLRGELLLSSVIHPERAAP